MKATTKALVLLVAAIAAASVCSIFLSFYYVYPIAPPVFAASVQEGRQKLHHVRPTVNATKEGTRKLGDGCYHVLLDVGANTGMHARFLFEPSRYPNAKIARKNLEEAFASPESSRDPRDFCVFAFEPNPAHRTRNRLLESHYNSETQNKNSYNGKSGGEDPKSGVRYRYVEAGVGDKDGVVEFYRNYDTSPNEVSFSAAVRRDDGWGMRGENKVKIPVLRLADWIRRHVEGRRIPATAHGSYYQSGNPTATSGPKVVMKIDVEGYEYLVLPDLIVSGVLCRTVDYAFGELYHQQESFYPLALLDSTTTEEATASSGDRDDGSDGEKRNTDKRKQERKRISSATTIASMDWKEATNFMEMALKLVRTSQNCKTKLIDEDDESYYTDPIPLF